MLALLVCWVTPRRYVIHQIRNPFNLLLNSSSFRSYVRMYGCDQLTELAATILPPRNWSTMLDFLSPIIGSFRLLIIFKRFVQPFLIYPNLKRV